MNDKTQDVTQENDVTILNGGGKEPPSGQNEIKNGGGKEPPTIEPKNGGGKEPPQLS